jgi:21S rRNA (GM2251-2'-O)-methyltransferase
MVLFSVIGSTLLRGQRFYLPPTFRRYKSLTAAIERGKHGGPDRPFRPRTRTPPGDVEDASPRTRAELRLERFGPSSDRREFTPKPSERPYTSRDEKPRSSRFGRVGSPRSRDDAPSRFREEREERPARNRDEFSQRQEGRFDSPFERPTRSGNRFDEERKPLSDRFERRERLAYRSDDRPSRRDREGYGQRDERPPRREGQFERPERRPFNRDDKFMGSQHRFSDRSSRGPSREGVSRRGEADRPDRPQRSRQSFTERDEMSPYTRERPEKAQTERYQSREVSQKQSETPTRTTGITEASRSTERGPEVLPYSTAASEFIYGYSSVLAAIKANRRKIYNLYVHSRGASRDGLMTRIRALKLFPVTQEVGDEYLRAMDKASSGRPHNGVVLESSPLPVPPITELKEASRDDESFRVTVDSQSAEDVLVNGKQEIYPYKSAGWRHPLILYVDGVVSNFPILYVLDSLANGRSLMKATLEPLLGLHTFSVSTPLLHLPAKPRLGVISPSKPPLALQKPSLFSKSVNPRTFSAGARGLGGEFTPAMPYPLHLLHQEKRRNQAATLSTRLRAAQNVFQ